MIYDDIVYGRVEINEPVVLEIIDSKEMQRLKWVDQAWYFEPYFPWSAHSRFEHSVWVYLLLRKYWAPLEEQIAGLIHDLSHWTFSHCLDYVFEEWNQKEQSHQDSVFDEFVRNSSIPSILEKYWFDVDNILNDDRHPLKEKNLPDLCADRIDYSLRDCIHYDKWSTDKVYFMINDLNVDIDRRVFSNLEVAKKYAEMFQKMNNIYRSGIESAVMFVTISDFLKYAWNKWYIERDDFYTTDKEVLDKITKYLDSDERLKLLWDRMNNKIPFENNKNNYNRSVFCKTRIVDPLFMKGWKIVRLSDEDIERKDVMMNKNKSKEYFIKFAK